MSTFQAYNDAAARMMVERFRDRLAPLMTEVAPDWLLHHIELRRVFENEQVEIRLVCRPIGSANVVPDPRGELPTPPVMVGREVRR